MARANKSAAASPRGVASHGRVELLDDDPRGAARRRRLSPDSSRAVTSVGEDGEVIRRVIVQAIKSSSTLSEDDLQSFRLRALGVGALVGIVADSGGAQFEIVSAVEQDVA